MKMILPRPVGVAGLALFALALTASASDKKLAPALLANAKVTREQAQKIVLGAVPNATVKSSELEEEDGGLRWSFDLQTPDHKRVTEVGVDAVTGKIVENKVESRKDEKKEARDEEKGHGKKD